MTTKRQWLTHAALTWALCVTGVHLLAVDVISGGALITLGVTGAFLVGWAGPDIWRK